MYYYITWKITGNLNSSNTNTSIVNYPHLKKLDIIIIFCGNSYVLQENMSVHNGLLWGEFH